MNIKSHYWDTRYHSSSLNAMVLPTNKTNWRSKTITLTFKFIQYKAYQSNSQIMDRELVALTKRISDYSMTGQVDYARTLFDSMPQRDSVVWNIMIKAYVYNRRIQKAREMFDEMRERTTVSWNSMIMGYTLEKKMDIALKLFFTMPNKDVVSWTTIVSGLARDNQLADAYKLFRQMPERNAISWSSIISGFQQNGVPAEALRLFREMLAVGIRPTSHSFTSVLTASADLSALFAGLQLYSQLIKGGYESNTHLGNSAITMFIKSGSLADARRVFIGMIQPDVVTWNSVIVGYGQHGYGMEAIMMFHQMQKACFFPDGISLLGVLQGCAHAGFVEEALMYFKSMEKEWGLTPGPEHYACMVDVYARAGMLKEAFAMISEMPFEPTDIFWRTLLNGCRIWGDFKLGGFAADQVMKLEPHNASALLMVIDMYESVGRWTEVVEIRRQMRERGARKELACSWVEVKGKMHLFSTKDESHVESDFIYKTLNLLTFDVAEYDGIHLHG